jgi:phage protein|nr:MAG TPA: distal tail protein [Caudoviricetes sp.]
METFKFKNVNSNDLGIIVKEMPPIIRAERNIESIEIAGRNGNLYIDNNTYKTKKYQINCILKNLDHIDEIKSLYLGKGKLELSTEANREYDAVISNKIDISKYLQYLKEFPLEFEVNPIAYSINEKIIEITKSQNISIDGNTNAKLTFIVFGIGTITINNIPVTVTESEVVIDCDLMNCTKNNMNKNDKVDLEEFPYLKNGENAITLGSGITKIKIIYKEGWL